MTRIHPTELPAFLRLFRFPGGWVRAVRVRQSPRKGISVEARLTLREATRNLETSANAVRIALQLDGVEEYRFQMRPNQPRAKIADARIVYLNGLFFVNLDAWGLEAGERPMVHDFRASEVYAAGRDLFWKKIEWRGLNERLLYPRANLSAVGSG